METELNIVEILKDKPKGTKLYSPLFGDVYLLSAENNAIRVGYHKEGIAIFFGNGKYYNYLESEPLLFPSKEMRDWSKFAWKKGDVLIKTNSEYCIGIFDKWTSDDYSTFSAKYINLGLSDSFSCSSTCKTKEWEKTENSKIYISKIERAMNGKLNLETLEIEKTQPKFKDWDFITIKLSKGGSLIGVFKAEDDKKYYLHANLDSRGIITISEDSYCKKSTCIARLSTEEEKQQFFDALAKKGKTWDAVKKQIVDLKLNDKLKPFDKVLVRDCLDEMWRPSFFACYLPFGREPYQVIGGEWVKLCIPYEGNESLLGTRTEI